MSPAELEGPVSGRRASLTDLTTQNENQNEANKVQNIPVTRNMHQV
jgi:hypothetical protein